MPNLHVRSTPHQLSLQSATFSVSVSQLVRIRPTYTEADFDAIVTAFQYTTKEYALKELNKHFKCKVHVNLAAIIMSIKFGHYVRSSELFRKGRNSSPYSYAVFMQERNNLLDFADKKQLDRLLSYVNIDKLISHNS